MKKSYSIKWVIQRITALFLIPLTFWFIFNCISFQYFQYEELQLFFQSYLNSFLFLVMMITIIIHSKLGCETILHDYVSSSYLQKTIKSIINFITVATFLLVIGATFKLSIL